MGKLAGVVKHVDVRGWMVYTIYAMYVSVGNFKKSVVTCKLPMGKLVGVVKHVDVHGCIVCTMYVVYVSAGNFKESVVTCKLPMEKLVGGGGGGSICSCWSTLFCCMCFNQNGTNVGLFTLMNSLKTRLIGFRCIFFAILSTKSYFFFLQLLWTRET